MSASRVIVTGGCGFIGSHLVDRLLAEGRRVTVLDNLSTGRRDNLAHHAQNANLEVHHAELASPGDWTDHFTGAQQVFHLAALADIVPSLQKPLDYYRSNVTGTAHVLEACRAHAVKKIAYAASSSCYGIPDRFPTAETAALRPEYPYALTKFLGEELVMHWNKVFKLPAVSLRFFNVFGPRSRTSGAYGAVFGVFLKQRLAKQPLTIVGDGTQTRDFTYVTDVVDALWTAAQSSVSGEIFNVGSGRTVSVNHLAELLGGECTHIPKRGGEPDCTFADTSKIQRMLNWKPQVNFEDGVQKMLGVIDYWQDAPLWTPDTIQEATQDWFRYLGSPKTASS